MCQQPMLPWVYEYTIHTHHSPEKSMKNPTKPDSAKNAGCYTYETRQNPTAADTFPDTFNITTANPTIHSLPITTNTHIYRPGFSNTPAPCYNRVWLSPKRCCIMDWVSGRTTYRPPV